MTGASKKPDGSAKPRRIVSASRRTDMVAFHGEALAAILRGEGRGPLSRLRADQVHSLVLWTKDFRPLLDCAPLRKATAACDQIVCQLTVTGLGGGPLEPRVPAADLLLPRLQELVDFLGDPRRLIWRFDPLIRWKELGNDELRHFEPLAPAFAAAGVTELRSSWVSPYGKVLRRLPALVVPPDEEVHAILARLSEAARGHGMHLACCCVPGMAATKCVDCALLSALHPRGEIIRTGKARQREGCGCDRSWDVGWYDHRCGHGCRYCYAGS